MGGRSRGGGFRKRHERKCETGGKLNRERGAGFLQNGGITMLRVRERVRMRWMPRDWAFCSSHGTGGLEHSTSALDYFYKTRRGRRTDAAAPMRRVYIFYISLAICSPAKFFFFWHLVNSRFAKWKGRLIGTSHTQHFPVLTSNQTWCILRIRAAARTCGAALSREIRGKGEGALCL